METEMKTINLPSGTYCLVTVPEIKVSLEIFRDNTLCVSNAGYRFTGKLPDGDWEIVGKASDMTEEQWKEIVEGYIYSGRISFKAYMDYSGKKPESMDDIISSAKESGRSLLSSHGFDLNTVILKLRQDGENM